MQNHHKENFEFMLEEGGFILVYSGVPPFPRARTYPPPETVTPKKLQGPWSGQPVRRQFLAGGGSAGVAPHWQPLVPQPARRRPAADQDLVQVVTSARFLSGNLATEQLRCFNIVGPLDWAGQQLLRVANGGRHIFVTPGPTDATPPPARKLSCWK